MKEPKKIILLVFGTRPEAIKMAPLVNTLKHDKGFHTIVCTTGQHKKMVDDALSIFKILPDIDLECMIEGQSLSDLTSKILENVGKVIAEIKPDFVLVHGDTVTTVGTALAAFFNKVKIGHVEAGLRTGNMFSPWPEEANRVIVSKLASINFAPTEVAKHNLLSEGISPNKILMTGNTVIDALLFVRNLIDSSESHQIALKRELVSIDFERPYILITTHRRENFGDGLKSIIRSIKRLALMHPDIQFVLPIHLNPLVKVPIETELGSTSNVVLIPAQQYVSFIYLMINSVLILTDSGGIQEEAPALGTPVLLMRDTTERPEAVNAGSVVMVGTDEEDIVSNVNKVILEKATFTKFDLDTNPYGTGDAAITISNWISMNV